ncbi:MAG TPA: hypothetical protein DCS63_03350 [Elusimicrobia bacterium]|nr:hypothetical protein [Elusimicrobiota bacterium]
MDKLRILITDDSSQIRELLWHTLTEEGHVVEFARDGDEVFKVLAMGHFDLIILDADMPGLNGYKVSEKIVKNIKNRPRIILYTSMDVEKEKLQFYCSEADAIIQKGAPVADIISTIHSFSGASGGPPAQPRPMIILKDDARQEVMGAAWMRDMPPAPAANAAAQARSLEKDVNFCVNKLAMLESILEEKNSKYESFIRNLLQEKSRSEGNAAEIKKLHASRGQALLVAYAALAAGVAAAALAFAR